jgi:leucyl/phenylalanyl-tRNA--protein transferase
MSRRQSKPESITTDMVLRAYSVGLFPMAERADDIAIHWIEPRLRGVIPLNNLHISKSLAKVIRADHFEIRVDTDFDAVIDACADRDETWINRRIRDLYKALFDEGHVHTVETWRDGKLVGGLYGVSLGAGFFGETMFHRETDASKVALAYLVARLIAGGYNLLDTQFLTPHLQSLGAVEIPRDDYLALLFHAINAQGQFNVWPSDRLPNGAEILAIIERASSKLR